MRLKWSVEGGENSAFNCLIKNILCTLPDPQCLIEPNFPFNAVAESIIHELVDFARDWIECGTITAGNEIIETVADALENFVDRHSEDGVTCRCLSCAKMTTADKDFMKKKIMKLVEEDLINALGSFMDRQSE